MSNLVIELREEQPLAIAELPYLSLQLNRDVTVAVQLKFVRETLVMPSDRFTQMPNVHHCLMGLIEHRSNVFWILDLPQLLGFPPLDSTAIETHICVLQIGDTFLGLGAYRIGRVVRFPETEILSPHELTKELTQKLTKVKTPDEIIPFLHGWIAQPKDFDCSLYVVDAQAIVSHKFIA